MVEELHIIQSLRAVRWARVLASGSWRNDPKRTAQEGNKERQESKNEQRTTPESTRHGPK